MLSERGIGTFYLDHRAVDNRGDMREVFDAFMEKENGVSQKWLDEESCRFVQLVENC